jgi:hypothetical protein
MGACSNLPSLPFQLPEAFQTNGASQASEPLAYYRQLIDMNPEDLRREYATVQAAYDSSPTAANRIKLVMALLVPDAPWKDDSQALKLLTAEPVMQGGKQGSRGDLVVLLDRLVSERVRLLRDETRKLEAAQQKLTSLREEHRKVEAMKQKLEAMNEECTKAEALQKKLEGLREIDRNLRKRPAPRNAP